MRQFLLGASAAALLAASPALAEGTLTIATIGEPSTLDLHLANVNLTGMVAQHMFEALFAFDDARQPVPHLAAAMPEVSEDGLTYKILLRTDVPFHNGDTMQASDVVASLNRWMVVASRGREMATMVESLESTAPDSITITLNTRYAPIVAELSNSAVIMPEEVLQDTLTEFVGTGPYTLGERRADQYIQLLRFDGYVSPEGEPNGWSGRREAIADELLFVPVPDANTRVEGLLAGEYDFADSLPYSAYSRIEGSGATTPVMLENSGWLSMNLNHAQGLMTSQPLRQAVQAALNAEDMMAAAFNEDTFYSVDGAFYPDGNIWHTDTGVTRYGTSDTELATSLLEDAGYDGAPLRILTSRQYEFHFNLAQVAEAYLEMAGFNVELDVVDWATLLQRRGDPSMWDIFITHSPFMSVPTMMNALSPAYAGWYDTPARDEGVSAYLAATTEEDQFAAWEDLQTVLYEEVPLYKVGNFNELTGIASGIEDYRAIYWPAFWNVTPPAE